MLNMKGFVILKPNKSHFLYFDVFGTLLVIIPYLIVIVTTLIHVFDHQRFLVDFLVPLELGFILLPGALIIVFTSMKSGHAFVPKAILFAICVVTMLIVMFVPSILNANSLGQNIERVLYYAMFTSAIIFDLSGLSLAVLTIIKLK